MRIPASIVARSRPAQTPPHFSAAHPSLETAPVEPAPSLSRLEVVAEEGSQLLANLRTVVTARGGDGVAVGPLAATSNAIPSEQLQLLLGRLDRLTAALWTVAGLNLSLAASPRPTQPSQLPVDPKRHETVELVVPDELRAAAATAVGLPAQTAVQPDPITQSPSIEVPGRRTPGQLGAMTFAEDGLGFTLVVRPIVSFKVIDLTTSLLRQIEPVSEVRLRRLQGGVAWFRVSYSGQMPAAAILDAALAPLRPLLTSTAPNQFEIEIDPALELVG